MKSENKESAVRLTGDRCLQMSAAALVCSSVLEIKEIKLRLEEGGKLIQLLANLIFVGEAFHSCHSPC